MKTIGLIGGLSWESSAEYYRLINEETRKKLGGLHSAKLLLYSFDFAEIEKLQHDDRWEDATDLMTTAAQNLAKAGADLVLICSNTMHRMAEAVQQAIDLPLLHIADATAKAIAAQGLHRVALLGTQFTMEQDFYKGRLVKQHQLEVIIPDAADRAIVHRVIYEELCLGKVEAISKTRYQKIIQALVEQGAEGIILGCTEIMLLIQPPDSPVPVFDTTTLHAIAAVEAALA
jgi:aspartate racemase